MINEELILAIDLGTSGPKVALVTFHGRVLDCQVGTTTTHILPGGGAEQNPDEWWTAVKNTTHQLLANHPEAAANIKGIGCTSQWSGTVAVDAHGRHLMNAIIWMDSRGAPYVQAVTNGLLKIEGYGLRRLLTWLRLTGGIPVRSGKDSIAHILYIKHQFPEIYRQTHKFLEPKDYLNLRLTGLFASSVDAITLHWLTDNRDIHHIRYNDTLIGYTTIDREKLPELKRAVDICGPLQPAVAQELGLPPHLPVIMGTPDLQSAAIGSGAVQDYEPHLYIGTSSWLTCHVPFKKTDLFHNMASLPSAIPGKYFIANEQETAGACLAYLRDNILNANDALACDPQVANMYAIFDEMVAQIPAGSDKVIFTPWLHGERTPVEDHLVRAGFYNLTLRTTRAHLIRAVFEGVAYNTRWLLRYVEKFARRPLNNIHMIGGGANSAVWCQIHADVLNRTIKQVQDPIEANVRGVALLTAVALGYTTFADINTQAPIVRVYEPNPAHRQIYDELFATFETIYQQNKKIYAQLNRG
ncbi:MAG TPA: FGGY-family carbohydrate kinase [Chloroflexota bacterium]|nr:FGGY-family carbohydrate kinase [Chloroflexota bacterium]